MKNLYLQISGDQKLSFIEKALWFIANFVKNLIRVNIDNKLSLRKYRLDIPIHILANISPDRSPGRRVCDIFWSTIPVELIIEKLVNVNILEVGCGKGVYASFINRIFKDKINSYTGIDINKFQEWESFDKKKFYFFKGDANDFSSYLDGKNLIITQSALEHFPNDLQYFKQLEKFVSSTNKPIIQIHMVPSHTGLWLYLLHGFRQYTVFRLSRITKLFSDNSTIKKLFFLGGRNCNRVHFKYFTSSLLGAYRGMENYNTEFCRAYMKDYSSHKLSNASFYCLVLLHNFGEEGVEFFSEG
jgi:SAM-dependent methyltransferase